MRLAAYVRRALLPSAALWLFFSPVPARAALRNPQVVVNGTGLQWYLDWVGEHINVETDQQDVQAFLPVVSVHSTMTYQFEVGPNDLGLELGIYDGHAVAPMLVPILPALSGPGWFTVVSFRPDPDRVVINVFNQAAQLVGHSTVPGVSANGFGMYAQGPAGTVYTQDARNPGGAVQALFFAGTGILAGNWWICFESDPTGDSDRDFDDLVVFSEVATGVPVHTSSWGQVKARFR